MPASRIIAAFHAIPRVAFLPRGMRQFANFDEPLPIGYGQTNSQPSTVRHMLEWLDPQPGSSVLDLGSGSGWTSALLGWLVGPKGHVHAVEIIPELLTLGWQNCQKLDITNVTFHAAGTTIGLPERAPYDRILVSASARELPMALIDQLALGGTMVLPVGSAVMVVTKPLVGRLTITSHPGFRFVPLVRPRKP